ncbi:MAG: DUF560 domain-containing protein [Desulfovibrionaceae bacterium]|nr:DUF560 domain-containing protein [Desulfovibrionaceae bacterium]
MAEEGQVGVEKTLSTAYPHAETRLTEQDVLALARICAGQGRTGEAVALYRLIIENSRKREYRAEAAFQLAGIFMLEGRFREAALLYLDILNHNPNLPRVRLELARAYFMNRDYEDAQLNFELVKGGDIPPEVEAKVDNFLTQIRRKKDWTLDFGATLVPDSNINQASGGKEECISFGNMLLCRQLEEKQSGIGLSVGGTFNYYVRFNRAFSLHNTVSLNALEYQKSDFDDYQLFLASGPRYTFDTGEISLQATFRKRWYAGEQYNEEYGLRLNTQKIIGRFILNSVTSYAKSSYADAYVDSFLHGDIWYFAFQPRYILNAQTFIQAGLAFQRETTRADAYGSDNWRYALGVYRLLPYGFSLFGEVSLTETDYHAPQWYVTSEHRIDETTRKDRTWQAFLHLSNNMLEKYDITPMLQYAYIKRNSNIWSREYDRHRINLSFNYRF